VPYRDALTSEAERAPRRLTSRGLEKGIVYVEVRPRLSGNLAVHSCDGFGGGEKDRVSFDLEKGETRIPDAAQRGSERNIPRGEVLKCRH